MPWSHPPIIKIYEALGAVADGRVKVTDNTAKVYSSSGNKYYDVTYDQDRNEIMANDNGSYWKGYLGYPAIAYLMSTGVLPYDLELGACMKGIAWKDINQKFKNDFDKSLNSILGNIDEDKKRQLSKYVGEVEEAIRKLGIGILGKKLKPPEGY